MCRSWETRYKYVDMGTGCVTLNHSCHGASLELPPQCGVTTSSRPVNDRANELFGRFLERVLGDPGIEPWENAERGRDPERINCESLLSRKESDRISKRTIS